MTVTVVDGVLVSNAQVSALDRAVLYGESAFELARAYAGRVFELGLHMDRLAATCAVLGIAAPDLTGDVALALAEFGPDAAVRMIVTRGNPEMEVPSRRIVIATAPKLPSPRDYREGIAAVIDRIHVVRGSSPLSGHKWAGYAPPTFAAVARAQALGAVEALLVNEEGSVVEGATSNVFSVEQGKVFTAASPGIRLGVIREVVLQICRAKGLEVSLVARPLEGADEVFITSSLRELVPVSSIDGRTVGRGSFDVARAIHRELRARAGASGPMPWE